MSSLTTRYLRGRPRARERQRNQFQWFLRGFGRRTDRALLLSTPSYEDASNFQASYQASVMQPRGFGRRIVERPGTMLTIPSYEDASDFQAPSSCTDS
ncbi:hypothetical protein BDQ17DRAFT_1437882 [Cyathus striatus]|nr:hypothetical protein BDQ17DRAFT_1437882 [Cyathus striatus]